MNRKQSVHWIYTHSLIILVFTLSGYLLLPVPGLFLALNQSLDQSLVSVGASDDVPTEKDKEPVDELKGRHKADAKTESKKSAEVGDEIKYCHLT